MTPLHLTHEEAIAVLNWHLAYERAVREVVEAALVYEHEMHIEDREARTQPTDFDSFAKFKCRYCQDVPLCGGCEPAAEIERTDAVNANVIQSVAGEEWALMTDLSRAEHAAPGSDAAIAAGCRCPVLDNCHGAGIPWPRTDGKDPTKWPSWYVREDCPLHGADSGWVNP